MQKAYYLSPHLARSRTPKDLNKCMSARLCVCQNEGESMREEREGVCGIDFR